MTDAGTMTIEKTITITIRCGICRTHTYSQDSATINETKKAARRHGWRRRRHSPSFSDEPPILVDVCPACLEYGWGITLP